MTLDEAIKHCKEKAEELSKQLDFIVDDETEKACISCMLEHEQLAEWLEELKERREKDIQKRNTCTCWVDYPNEAHKKANGKWKCVDCYENTGSRDGYKRKTRCIKKTESEDDEVTDALKEIRTWQ